MRKTPWIAAERYRVLVPGYESRYGDDYGMFAVSRPAGLLRIMASSGHDEPGWEWEHVSVSLVNRTPNWPEMCFVKDLFWAEEETVMQLHVPATDHQNLMEHCLHLWRPTLLVIPRPPSEAVAVPGNLEENRRYLASRGS